MNRRPYSIYRRREWIPITVTIAGLTLAACAVALILYSMAGVHFQ